MWRFADACTRLLDRFFLGRPQELFRPELPPPASAHERVFTPSGMCPDYGCEHADYCPGPIGPTRRSTNTAGGWR